MTPRCRPTYRDPNEGHVSTKEEQLLGYTAADRQRIKALHTLGLTEGGLDKCRSVLLSSLGHTENMENTAVMVATAADAEEGWTPADSWRKYSGSARSFFGTGSKSSVWNRPATANQAL